MKIFLIECWNTLCVLAPWLLFGAFLAGFLHVALPANWLRKNLQGNWGVAKSVLLGIPLPLCSCGVIPAGVGLKKNGASDGAAIGFLISTPQTGVDSVFVSASVFGWPFAIFKMVLAAVTGMIGGCLAVSTRSSEITARPSTTPDSKPIQRTVHWSRRWLDHSTELIRSIWKWLVLGILASAVITIWIVPTPAFQQLSDANLITSLSLMLLVSLPLYVCATASIPIAAALVSGGIPVASALVFLIAGPATNLATIGAIYSQFGVRNTVTYLLTLLLGSIGGAFIFDQIWGSTALPFTPQVHEHLSGFSVTSGIVLLGLFSWFAYGETLTRIRKRIASRQVGSCHRKKISLRVAGMNCQSCVASIESELFKLSGIKEVSVDLESGVVQIEGSSEIPAILKAVTAAGFQVQPDDGDTGNIC